MKNKSVIVKWHNDTTTQGWTKPDSLTLQATKDGFMLIDREHPSTAR